MKYAPPIGSTDPNAGYVDRTGSMPGSPVPAAAIEPTMREIENVILNSGLTPDGSDVTQLWQAISSRGRTACAADTTYYVRTDGNDTNNGLTGATAKKTVASVISAMRTVDGRGYGITIDVGPGTFESGQIQIYASSNALESDVILQGAGKDITILKSMETLLSVCGMNVTVRDATLQGAVYAGDSGFVTLSGDIALLMPANTKPHILAEYGGKVCIKAASCDVRGNSVAFLSAGAGGIAQVARSGIAFSGNAFVNGVCEVSTSGTVIWDKIYTYTGTCTGKRFAVNHGGVLSCGDVQPDAFLPGTVAGSLSDNGLVGGTVANTFPKGGIILWSGTTAPAGWALCNGSSGTPDLRDRFVLAAGTAYPVGAKGGAMSTVTGGRTLTETQMTPHFHSIAITGGDNSIGIRDGSGPARYGYTNTGTTGGGQEHTHPLTLPPYYALAYIMKL